MQTFQYTFTEIPQDVKEILIAILSENLFLGFEERGNNLYAYTQFKNENRVKEIIAPFALAYTLSIIDETNWNAQWEQGFEPVVVYNKDGTQIFACVRAHFHKPMTGVLYDILITPKMSFGTGHHATTVGMMQAMEQLDFSNKTVIDFGTGTGVLAILAEKLGAAKVIAIDNDPWSINNAKENIATNNCTNIELVQANEMPVNITAGIILANINLNVIVDNLKKIFSCSVANSTILLSGMLEQDSLIISATLLANNFTIINITVNNGWLIICTTPIQKTFKF